MGAETIAALAAANAATAAEALMVAAKREVGSHLHLGTISR